MTLEEFNKHEFNFHKKLNKYDLEFANRTYLDEFLKDVNKQDVIFLREDVLFKTDTYFICIKHSNMSESGYTRQFNYINKIKNNSKALFIITSINQEQNLLCNGQLLEQISSIKTEQLDELYDIMMYIKNTNGKLVISPSVQYAYNDNKFTYRYDFDNNRIIDITIDLSDLEKSFEWFYLIKSIINKHIFNEKLLDDYD